MSRAAHPSRSVADTAAQWVARHDAGLAAAEQVELERWLAANPTHRAAYERYAALMSAVGRPKRTGAAAELESRLERLAQKRARQRTALGGTAAMVMLVAVIFLMWPRGFRKAATVVPPTATLILPRQQLLSDGTRVEFPDGAEFAVDFSRQMRRVRLVRGEAIFFVAKNAEWPFVVEAGGVEFRAVGTAFAVNLRADAADLVVTEGRVAVERDGAPVLLRSADAEAPTPRVVTAGNRVSVAWGDSTAAAGAISRVSDGEVAERLAWRRPRAEFSGATLREVVELLNRQNATKLVLADGTLADVQLSGVFRTDDLDSLVRALELGFGVRAERAEREIRLRRAER